MNSNMVKPEKFDHLHLVYHFTIPLKKTCELIMSCVPARQRSNSATFCNVNKTRRQDRSPKFYWKGTLSKVEPNNFTKAKNLKLYIRNDLRLMQKSAT